MYTYIHIYVYIYIEREGEIYIYIYIYIERERHTYIYIYIYIVRAARTLHLLIPCTVYFLRDLFSCTALCTSKGFPTSGRCTSGKAITSPRKRVRTLGHLKQKRHELIFPLDSLLAALLKYAQSPY